MRVICAALAVNVVVNQNVCAGEPISVDASVSWMTPLQPEVHLLIRSDEQVAGEFQVEFGFGGGIKCSEELKTGNPQIDNRLHRFNS